MRKLVLGDLHGAYKALLQVFERSHFDYEKDILISLGDIADGWPFVKECLDELLKVKNLIMIAANHDEWFLNWAEGRWEETDRAAHLWTSQGGLATLESYGYDRLNVPKEHIKLLKEAPLYHYANDQVFAHGGIIYHLPLEHTDRDVFLWDRDLVQMAFYNAGLKPFPVFGGYKDIFLGHTTTQYFNNSLKPMHLCNVWAVDTGAGWSDKLTLMDVDTKEYWQSDLVKELYPNLKGRD